MDTMCRNALSFIDDGNEYHTGKKKEATGVCDGLDLTGCGCGIFVKKKKSHPKDSECRIKGPELRAKVQDIRSRGCKRCGRLPVDWDDTCEVKVDFVHGCKETH